LDPHGNVNAAGGGSDFVVLLLFGQPGLLVPSLYSYCSIPHKGKEIIQQKNLEGNQY
jgi:hypothetical protein